MSIADRDTLLKKAKLAKEDQELFKRKANKILYDLFTGSAYYPECHNNENKKVCDRCMNCFDIACNQSNCDRVGRCLCPGTTCICLGRC